MCKLLHHFSRYSIALNPIFPACTLSPTFPNFLSLLQQMDISNKPTFRQEHPGVPDGPDGSDRTSYTLIVNQMRPIAQWTDPVAYSPCGSYYTMSLILATCRVVYYPVEARHPGVALPLLCVRNVVMYTHHQNNWCVTLFTGAPVML